MATITIDRETTTIPDAPDIAGLVFRAFRGESDYPTIAAVLQGSSDADQIEEVRTAEDVAREYAHLTNCDPYRDVSLVEVNGQVVGYKRVTWWKESNGAYIYFHVAYLLPAWRGQGIGRAMLRHSERRLREIAAEHATDEGAFFETFAYQTQPGLESLLREEGYAPMRYFYDMVRENLDDIPAAPLPPGLEVRPVEPAHYRTIWEALDEAFRDHWGHSPATEEDYQLWLKDPNFDPSLWRVAWAGDEVAGMVLSYIDVRENAKYNRQRGWTEDICVRRPWRRRGLARALLVQSLHAVKERGMTEAALGVDTANPNGALSLYESVGFQVAKRITVYRKLVV